MGYDHPAVGWELIRRSRVWCREFGLPDDWLEELLKERDDWAFCIKLAAIAEDAVKEALTKHVQPPALAQIATKQPPTARIELLLKLNLVEANEADGLRAIAAVRNGYAHSVRNLRQSISGFLDRESKEGNARFNQLANAYRPAPNDTPAENGWLAANQPRMALWLALVVVLARLYGVSQGADLKAP